MRLRRMMVIVLALIALGRYAVGGEAIKITLDGALQKAHSANRDIEIAKERLLQFEGLKQEALSGGLPQITATGEYQRIFKKPKIIINDIPFQVGNSNTYTTSIGLSQLVWDGGKVVNAVKSARSELNSTRQNIRDVEAEVRKDVKQTFYLILYTDKMLDVLRKKLNQLTSHLNSIKTRYNQGIESDYTLMRQEVEVINLKPEITDAERNREFLLNSLKILLGINPEDELVPEGKLSYTIYPLPPLEEFLNMSRSSRPDLLAARFHKDALEKKIGMEKASYWPSLNLVADYEWIGEADGWDIPRDQRRETLLGTVSLSWPIFEGLKTRARVKQAKSEFNQQKSFTDKLEAGVVRDVEDAYTALLKARQDLVTQRRALSLAVKASRIAGERFEAGLMSQIELNDTINAWEKAEQLYYEAIVQCLSAEAALERAAGGEI